MMRSGRQAAILEIIAGKEIETQEELCAELNKRNYSVTQATVSRDIRELRLTKVSCGLGVYKYVVSGQENLTTSVKYLNILRETVNGVDHAGNIVVVKTYSGMAQAAAAALDNMGWTEIIGTIAGDDTIMLVLRSTEACRTFSMELSGLLNIK